MVIFKLLFLLLTLSSQIIAEDLYQYTDKSGNLVIGNKKTNGGSLFPLETGTGSPDKNTRRKILREELAHEIFALKQSLKLQEQDTASNKALYYKDITRHQNNINVLTKQLNHEG